MDDSHTSAAGDEQNLFRPGDEIRPATTQKDTQEPAAAVDQPQAEPAPDTVTPPMVSAPGMAGEPEMGDASISWTASEFIAHQKNAAWYGALALATVAITTAVWFLTKDPIATGCVVIGMAIFGFYAAHKPRQQAYTIDGSGLAIGQQRYGFSDFRSFSVIQEEGAYSVQLAPLKRFATYLTVYIDPKDRDKIIDLLSSYLPMEEARPNLTDGFLRRIRF